MQTLTERAARLWNRYGRIDARGRVYLADEYIGRIGKDTAGQPFTMLPREHRIGYLGVQPIQLVTMHISR